MFDPAISLAFAIASLRVSGRTNVPADWLVVGVSVPEAVAPVAELVVVEVAVAEVATPVAELVGVKLSVAEGVIVDFDPDEDGEKLAVAEDVTTVASWLGVELTSGPGDCGAHPLANPPSRMAHATTNPRRLMAWSARQKRWCSGTAS